MHQGCFQVPCPGRCVSNPTVLQPAPHAKLQASLQERVRPASRAQKSFLDDLAGPWKSARSEKAFFFEGLKIILLGVVLIFVFTRWKAGLISLKLLNPAAAQTQPRRV